VGKFVSNDRVIMHCKPKGIGDEVVVAYFNLLFLHIT